MLFVYAASNWFMLRIKPSKITGTTVQELQGKSEKFYMTDCRKFIVQVPHVSSDIKLWYIRQDHISSMQLQDEVVLLYAQNGRSCVKENMGSKILINPSKEKETPERFDAKVCTHFLCF